MKNAIKPTLVECPEIRAEDRPDTVSVEINSAKNAYVVTVRMLVGAPKEKKPTEGDFSWIDSGVLNLDNLIIQIGGVEHKLTTRKAQWNKKGQRIGSDCLVVRPATAKKTEPKKSEEIPF